MSCPCSSVLAPKNMILSDSGSACGDSGTLVLLLDPQIFRLDIRLPSMEAVQMEVAAASCLEMMHHPPQHAYPNAHTVHFEEEALT